MIRAIDKIPAIYAQQYPKFVYPTPPAQKCRKCGKEQHKLTHKLCNHCIDTAWGHFVEVITSDLYVVREWHKEA